MTPFQPPVEHERREALLKGRGQLGAALLFLDPGVLLLLMVPTLPDPVHPLDEPFYSVRSFSWVVALLLLGSAAPVRALAWLTWAVALATVVQVFQPALVAADLRVQLRLPMLSLTQCVVAGLAWSCWAPVSAVCSGLARVAGVWSLVVLALTVVFYERVVEPWLMVGIIVGFLLMQVLLASLLVGERRRGEAEEQLPP